MLDRRKLPTARVVTDLPRMEPAALAFLAHDGRVGTLTVFAQFWLRHLVSRCNLDGSAFNVSVRGQWCGGYGG